MTATSAIATHPDVVANLNLFASWLQAKMAYEGLPGTVVGVVHDQELIFAAGFGRADVERDTPADADTIFRIASHSKLFTAISVMQQRDAGNLQLDDPVEKHLSWFNIANEFGEARPITIRHLLTHTSGLPREAGSNYWQEFDFPDLATVRERLPGQQTIYPTETRWKYSNLALTIAGEVVAAVSEQSYADYVQEHILTPLDMTSTSVVFPDADRARLATGYGCRMPDGTQGTFPFVDAVGMAAATGLSSTVADMAKFIAWQFRLLDDGADEVLAANTLKEMQRLQWIQPDWKSGWGIGFGIEHTPERDLIGHGGGYPGYLTSTRISPKERVGVIVFTNSLDGQPQFISDRVFSWVAPAIVAAAADEPGDAPDPAWSGYEGPYRSLWSDTQIQFVDGKLRLFAPRSPNPKAEWVTLEPAGDHTFTIDGPGSGPIGEKVVFSIGPDGVATSVKVAEGISERVAYDIPIQRSV